MRTSSFAALLKDFADSDMHTNSEMKCISLFSLHWKYPLEWPLAAKNCLVASSVPIEQKHIDHERQPCPCTSLFFFFSTCSHFYLFICFLSHTLLWGSSWIINVELLNAPYSGHRSCSERLPRSHSWLVGAGLENKSTTSVQQHRHTHLRCTGDAFAGSWWKISPHHK